MNAYGSSWLSQLQPGTCMKSIQRRSRCWWVPYYRKRSSLSSRDFGISSDPHNLSSRAGSGLLLVSRSGPTMIARIGGMKALNRYVVREFNPDRKETRWGKRKLKRDQ